MMKYERLNVMCKECCIVAAGPSPVFVKKDAFIIAADGGLEKLALSGLSPDLVIGDFDSLGVSPVGDNVIAFPPEKDDTDTMLAIKEALKRGYEKIYISGGVGGRLDHTVANLQSLIFAAKFGTEAYLCSENETVTVLNGTSAEFSSDSKGKISVFSFGDSATGVNISGLKYNTVGASISNMFPIGVSNEFVEGIPARISAESGIIAIIWDGVPDDVTIVRKA